MRQDEMDLLADKIITQLKHTYQAKRTSTLAEIDAEIEKLEIEYQEKLKKLDDECCGFK